MCLSRIQRKRQIVSIIGLFLWGIPNQIVLKFPLTQWFYFETNMIKRILTWSQKPRSKSCFLSLWCQASISSSVQWRDYDSKFTFINNSLLFLLYRLSQNNLSNSHGFNYHLKTGDSCSCIYNPDHSPVFIPKYQSIHISQVTQINTSKVNSFSVHPPSIKLLLSLSSGSQSSELDTGRLPRPFFHSTQLPPIHDFNPDKIRQD